jgi:hypothetical protein
MSHVVRMRRWKLQRASSQKSCREEMTILAPELRWEDNIKMKSRGADWFKMNQGRVQGRL